MFQEISEILSFPFIQRAIIGGVLVAVLTSWMGTLVVLRQASFFGDAIAHSSLMGVALGLLLGFNPILAAALYAILVSFGLPYLKKSSKLPTDSLLGFVLPFSMGIGVILLTYIPGYQPELVSFLFGSILSVGWTDIAVVAGLTTVTALVMLVVKNKLLLTSFDSEYAKVSGIKVEKIDVIYNILLAVTIVTGIRLVGIILINALLVIPASTIRLQAKSLKEMFIYSPLLAVGVTLAGLGLSFFTNLPTGPAIAVMAGLVFLLAVIRHGK